MNVREPMAHPRSKPEPVWPWSVAVGLLISGVILLLLSGNPIVI